MAEQARIMKDGYGLETAKEYDSIVETYGYNYNIILEAASLELEFLFLNDTRPSISIVDFGAGTGKISFEIGQMFYQKYNVNSRILLLDRSHEMMAAGLKDRNWTQFSEVRCDKQDLEKVDLSETYDIAICGFALHHLDSNDKRVFINKVFNFLNPGGSFVILDRMVADNSEYSSRHLFATAKKAKSLFEKIYGRQLNEAECLQMAKEQFHQDGDRPDSLEQHKYWFDKAGFINIMCPYFNFGYAIVSAQKPF